MFWTDNPRVLVQMDKLTSIVPSNDLSLDERLNAIARLSMYVALALMIYKRSSWPIVIGVVGLFVTAYIYQNKSEGFQEMDPIERAIYDTEYRPETKTKQLKRKDCHMPTRDNPFMNVLTSDYSLNPSKKPACNDTPKVKQNIEGHFNHNLYKDINDIFDKNNGQRQFYTMPSTTIPNDQGGFAKWLWGIRSPTCKEDTRYCTPEVQDMRHGHRPVIPQLCQK